MKKKYFNSVDNLYDLALLLAEAQSRNSKNRHACFIENLSRICDAFAISKQLIDIEMPNDSLGAEIVNQILSFSQFSNPSKIDKWQEIY